MDTIGLLVGRYDPPALDHSKAAEVLASTKGISQVWLCPLQFTVPEDGWPGIAEHAQHVRNMCTILATDLSSAGLPVAACTVALDNKTQPAMNEVCQVLAACRSKFPYYKFRAALVVGGVGISDRPPPPTPQYEDLEEDTLIFKFAGDDPTARRGIPVVVRYAPPQDLWLKLMAGRDESRHFCEPVWNYIQSHGIYRQKPQAKTGTQVDSEIRRELQAKQQHLQQHPTGVGENGDFYCGTSLNLLYAEMARIQNTTPEEIQKRYEGD